MSERTKRAYDRWAATYDADPNLHLTLEHNAVLRLVVPAPGEHITRHRLWHRTLYGCLPCSGSIHHPANLKQGA